MQNEPSASWYIPTAHMHEGETGTNTSAQEVTHAGLDQESNPTAAQCVMHFINNTKISRMMIVEIYAQATIYRSVQ